MPTFTIDGVNLQTALGITVTRESTFHGMPQTRSSNLSLPGVHGGVVVQTEELYEPGTCVLQCWMDGGGNPVTHEAKLDAFKGLLVGPLDVRKTMSDASVRQALCYMRATLDPEHRPGAWTKLTVPLELPGAFWRDTVASTFSQSQPVNGTTYVMSNLAGSTAPITDAVLLWTGPISNPQATDPFSGSSVTWQGTIAAGSQVRVQASTLTAISGVGIGLTGPGADVSGNLVPSGPGSAYRLLEFQPEMVASDPLNRRVSVKVNGSGMTSATNLQVSARRAFL